MAPLLKGEPFLTERSSGMHILVCDDNASFGAKLAGYVQDYFEARGLQVETAVCTSGEQALQVPELELYQLAFLDVDMPGLNGIALGRELKKHTPEVKLVYVSAYLEFAPEGYTVSAYRYLLKKDIVRLLPGCLDDLMSVLTDQRKTLTVHCSRETFEVPLDQIYYLESDHHKINLYGDIAHRVSYVFYGKIAELPEMLYKNGFLQVSRSDVVNLQYVCSISNYKVLMKNGVVLSTSRTGYAAIRNAYLEWKGQFADE